MKLRNIHRPEIEKAFQETGILHILEKNGITFEELTHFNSAELKGLFGNAYFEYLNLLRNHKKEKNIQTNLEIVKQRLQFVMDVFFDKNPHGEIGEHLRERQKQAVIKTLDFLLHSPSETGYIHFPTSSGKTVMFADIIRNILLQSSNKKIIITVPNKEALKRSKQEFEKLAIPTSLYFGEQKDLSQNIVIATTQSLLNALGKNEINKNTFDLMICDEAHERYLGEKTSECINSFQCKKIGFTATPELRNKNVETLFTQKIDEYLIDEAIANKELPEVNAQMVFQIGNKEFEKLQTQNGDFTKESLEKFDVRETFPHILEAFKNGKLAGKQMAIFMPSVKLSKELSHYLNENEVKSGHIDGTTKNREEIQEDFEQKEIQVICSCDALKSSWDSDIIDGVIILKPTLSPAVYMQMVGRALHGKMLDANGNKVPKDEIIVCDIVNDQNEIAARHITTRGLSSILQLTRKQDREKISINKSEYISEILFYYDVENIFSLEGLEGIYQQFAEIYQMDFEEFLETLEERTEELEAQNHSITITLTSNDRFGESYAGREKDFEFSLKTIRKILKIYKKTKLESEILKVKIDVKKATKEQLQELWRNGEISQNDISYRKWQDFAKNWNIQYSKERGYRLPTSIKGMLGGLGGSEDMSCTKSYMISLFEGKDTYSDNTITKERFQELWKKGLIDTENISNQIKWSQYAKKWNEQNSKEKGSTIPVSLGGCIALLGGDCKISQSKEYILSLLEGKTYKNIPIISKEEIQNLWNTGVINSECIGNRKRLEFAEKWNEKESQKAGYRLPSSIGGLISRLGGNKDKKSYDYKISLLEGIKYEVIIEGKMVVKEELQALWSNGEIDRNFTTNKRKVYANGWNEINAKEKGFILPISIHSLIGILGGNIEKSQKKEYIVSLLEGKPFEKMKEQRLATKQELQELWSNGEISIFSGTYKCKEYALDWNEKNAKEKGYRLPTTKDGMIGILGGDKTVSKTKSYIVSLLEGKTFEK